MSIRARMIILPLSSLLHYCLTKTSKLTVVGYNNDTLQSCWMVVTTYVHAPSWHDGLCVCTLTHLVPYPLHKFILTSWFSYLWLWRIYVITWYHFLSADYFCVWLVHLFNYSLCLHNVEAFFCTITFVSTLYPVLSHSVSMLYSIISPHVSMLDPIFLGLT